MYETGDAAIRDKDGRYQIAGRMDDIINIGRVAKPRFARDGLARVAKISNPCPTYVCYSRFFQYFLGFLRTSRIL